MTERLDLLKSPPAARKTDRVDSMTRALLHVWADDVRSGRDGFPNLIVGDAIRIVDEVDRQLAGGEVKG